MKRKSEITDMVLDRRKSLDKANDLAKNPETLQDATVLLRKIHRDYTLNVLRPSVDMKNIAVETLELLISSFVKLEQFDKALEYTEHLSTHHSSETAIIFNLFALIIESSLIPKNTKCLAHICRAYYFLVLNNYSNALKDLKMALNEKENIIVTNDYEKCELKISVLEKRITEKESELSRCTAEARSFIVQENYSKALHSIWGQLKYQAFPPSIATNILTEIVEKAQLSLPPLGNTREEHLLFSDVVSELLAVKEYRHYSQDQLNLCYAKACSRLKDYDMALSLCDKIIEGRSKNKVLWICKAHLAFFNEGSVEFKEQMENEQFLDNQLQSLKDELLKKKNDAEPLINSTFAP